MTYPELAKALDLQRPLVWLDLETTGTIPKVDRAVQIGTIKIDVDGQVEEKVTLVNPTIPIPPESTEIHGITDEMVRDAPTFVQLAKSLSQFLYMVDFGGFSVPFDLSVLRAEFDRAQVLATLNGRIVDALRITRKYNPHDLTTTHKLYTGRDLPGAHDAMVDTRAALDTFIGQLEKHPDIPRTVEGIHVEYFETKRSTSHIDVEGRLAWRSGQACINFGDKYPGVPLQSVDSGYLKWMLRGEFSDTVKDIVRDALVGKFPTREVK